MSCVTSTNKKLELFNRIKIDVCGLKVPKTLNSADSLLLFIQNVPASNISPVSLNINTYFTDASVNPCDYTSCSIVDSTGSIPSWISGFVFTEK